MDKALAWYNGWAVVIKTFPGHRGRPGQVGGSLPKGVSAPELTKEEVDAIGHYTETSWGPINDDLRGGKPLSERDQEIVKGLDSAIDKSVLDKDMVVYRGVGSGPGIRIFGTGGRIPVGHEFSDKAYISTSASRQTASLRGRKTGFEGNYYLFEVQLKKGQRALETGEHSSWGAEGEFLLPRGTKFKITGKDYDYAGGREDVSYIILEVLD